VHANSKANLVRPLFLVFNLLLLTPTPTLTTVTKIPEGVVVGFQNMAWASNKHPYPRNYDIFGGGRGGRGGNGRYFQKMLYDSEISKFTKIEGFSIRYSQPAIVN
jgi:hypothetical protein